jgi:hypothetical protein
MDEIKDIKTSPVPELSHVQQVSSGMSFVDAMEEIKEGKKVTREEWNDNTTFGLMKDDRLMICIKGKYSQWIISSGDMFNDDWTVVLE